MATVEVSNNVRDHGTLVDEVKNRVECKYCSKEVAGFSRLKYHLGCVRGDVRPCENVPEDLKILMRNSLLERKKNVLNREVRQLFHSDLPWKSSSSSNSSVSKKRNHSVTNPVPEECTVRSILESSQEVLVSENAYKIVKDEEDLSRPVKRNIARFFIENGIDSSAASSRTFKEMVDAIIKQGSTGFKISSCDELSGLFQDEVKDIHHYVKEVRQSWRSTGCSILLDGWTDEKGCSLISFLVDCPKGSIFLKSADITGSLGNVNAMISLLDEVIEDVGVANVVQVITYTTSDFMVEVGKQLVTKYKTIFWSVCASHCITLMLEKIGMMKSMRRVLSQVKNFTDFIYSDDALLRLVREHTHQRDLIASSRMKLAIPFFTLETIVSENENLMNFFNSSAWRTSNWARTTKGREVANLVENPTFWTELSVVVKATIPLVRSLLLINGGDDKPQIPYIYETMDQVKETIKEEFENKKSKYTPVWRVIDEIWDNILHSPLHSAGYFFNPSLFYTSDFSADSEVASGLLCCMVRMIEDRKNQDLISLQLDKYRLAKGTFGEKIAVDHRTMLPPGFLA
ncbi:hypothetical protein AQUCO_01800253v1 [Aquilegia coerulea]|uniref:DUF659 domain-containing protein n=1 Tax=Aquilegia coerulea TaxID=218851 RepID=A0A2G5DKQ1_AQUCA|nr:hypothetical protein AQUCO_01800253v1 [Aquilegia coerulea]